MATPRRPPRTPSNRHLITEVEDGSEKHSVVDTLMNMGFSRSRCEKAVATTGALTDSQVSECVNWLLSHLEDPNMDEDESREYILYLCPSSGTLAEGVDKFWTESKKHAPNGAHESFPHIRLTTFFKVHNGLMPKLVRTVESVIQSSEYVHGSYDLEYQSLHDTSYKYVGLFVSDNDDNLLHDLADELARKTAKIGVQLEPYTRHMHMSLAYRFTDDQHTKIEELASKIDTSAKCQWEMRIYSRDLRIPSHELREVTHKYDSLQQDELALEIGDIVLTVPDSIQDSVDGWFSGISLKNGKLGVFPGNYTQKTQLEHKLWTLAKTIPMVSNSPEKVQLYENLDSIGEKSSQSPSAQELKLLVIRHAERVDAVMGKDWVRTCFEDSGKEKFLKRFNLNMPHKYVKRRSINDFERDPPITEIGRFQAELIGKALGSSPLRISAIYSSPSLRCVGTADSIIKQFPTEKKVTIRIENGLFEWNRWHTILPTFMPSHELKEQGFDIDTSYKSEMLAFDLMESLDDYYERSLKLMQTISERHGRGGGTVLLLGHAASPEVISRKLMKKPHLPQREFVALINKIPFCEPVLVSRSDGKWSVGAPPIPKLWHLDNKKFDMKLLSSE